MSSTNLVVFLSLRLNVVPAFHAVLVKDLLKEQKALQEGVPMVVAQAVGADTSGATYSITFDELVQLGHQMRKVRQR